MLTCKETTFRTLKMLSWQIKMATEAKKFFFSMIKSKAKSKSVSVTKNGRCTFSLSSRCCSCSDLCTSEKLKLSQFTLSVSEWNVPAYKTKEKNKCVEYDIEKKEILVSMAMVLVRTLPSYRNWREKESLSFFWKRLL
jgi:hypothetical protein